MDNICMVDKKVFLMTDWGLRMVECDSMLNAVGNLKAKFKVGKTIKSLPFLYKTKMNISAKGN